MRKNYEEIPVPKIVLTVRSPTALGDKFDFQKDSAVEDETFLDESKTYGPSLKSIQPRYQSEILAGQLRAQIGVLKKTPMDFYDSELYTLCKKWNTLIPGFSLSFDCIKRIHHICTLKEKEQDLKVQDAEAVNSEFERILHSSPSIFAEYNLCKEALSLISGLAIKYKTVSFHDFYYRQTDRALNVKLLDLSALNSDVFTIDCLWLSTIVDLSPLDCICSDIVKQYAIILRDIGEKLMSFLGRLNTDCRFTEIPSIERLVAAKNDKVAKMKNIIPDYDAETVNYQKLKLRRGLLALCIRSGEAKNALELKDLINDFSRAYTQFEEELISNFLIGI